jgi:hypothetical protein
MDGVSDAPIFVAEAPHRRRSREGSVEALRERVRELGVDLRRNRAEAPPPARMAHTPAAPAPPRWEGRIAKEFFEDFHDAASPKVTTAFDDGEERHLLADGAYAMARFAFSASATIGPAVAFVFDFLLARFALAMKMLLVILLVLAVAGLLRDWPKPARTAATSSAPAATWAEIVKPYALFDLSAPILGHDQPAYAARRHVAGGGREDTLAFGAFGGDKLFLRFSIYRHGTEDVADPGYFVDMARRASVSGLGVTGADLPQAMPTRFGEFESAPLALSGPTGMERGNCRGFRTEIEAPALTMGGLICGGGEETVSAAEVACVIDRLDLLSAGQDRALADFFGVAAARKSRACVEAAARK